ncbi:MAG: septum formation initiator family protein [Raineya sp.]|nr:septum formation initiator family protein [Raineya sp.]MDW8297205.1 septum formation initiator family protein [Raineya sp.]
MKKILTQILQKASKFRIPQFMKNFYFVVGSIFLVWMLFFDTNDLISQYRWRKKYKRLLQEKAYYLELQNTLKQNIKDFNDRENFEKFAREKHLLQKPNEDVFLIIEK